MSYHEAKADGVRISTCKGQSVYYPLCMFCGQEVFSYHYLRNVNYTCRECRPHKRVLLSTGIFPDKRKHAHDEKENT